LDFPKLLLKIQIDFVALLEPHIERLRRSSAKYPHEMAEHDIKSDREDGVSRNSKPTIACLLILDVIILPGEPLPG